MLRHNWSNSEIKALFELPLLDLVYQAASVHRENQKHNQVQLSTLISVKTGTCPEDCKYCSQSARYETKIELNKLMEVDQVLETAKKAKENGSSRLCMGAAWRSPKDGPDFDKILKMVKGVKELGLETCCTLGMLSADQAKALGDAGLDFYNHNLDTSPEYYKEIITTRSYADRIETIKNVRSANLKVCCGGIVGMGETLDDRVELLKQLSSLNPHPESVPINALVPVAGTPLGHLKKIEPLDFVRMIAVTRIVMPKSTVRLSAGRLELSKEAQAMCFMAGANSIFAGDKLLTTPNPDAAEDNVMMKELGLTKQPVHAH
jgi:biotin synthase